VGPRTSLDILEKRKSLALLGLRQQIPQISLLMTSCCDIRTAEKKYTQSVTTIFTSVFRLLHVLALWIAIIRQLKVYNEKQFK
jgi:hypothetical protein